MNQDSSFFDIPQEKNPDHSSFPEELRIFGLFYYFCFLNLAVSNLCSLDIFLNFLLIFWLCYLKKRVKNQILQETFSFIFLLLFMSKAFHNLLAQPNNKVAYFLLGHSNEMLLILFSEFQECVISYFAKVVLLIFLVLELIFREEGWQLVALMFLHLPPFFCLLQEKTFAKQNIRKDSFVSLQKIIKEALPIPILILNQNCSEVLEYNPPVKNLFNFECKEEILKEAKCLSLKPMTSNKEKLTISQLSSYFALNKVNGFISLEGMLSQKEENVKNSIKKTERNFNIKAGKILWNSTPAIFIAFHETLSEEIIDQLKKQDEFKNVISTVSQDLRLPTNSILGLIVMSLASLKDTKALKTYLTTALKSCHFLSFILNDFLDDCQITAHNKLALNIQSQKITKTLEIVYDLIKFQCEKKKITLQFANSLPKDTVITTDHRRLQQILLNILGNALKSTNVGFIRLLIEPTTICKRPYVSFIVEDSGIGIKPENNSKVFSDFGTIPQDDPDLNSSGVDMGLLISKKLVKQLCPEGNGDIKIESKYGKATAFSFFIPMNYDEPDLSDINEEHLFKKQVYVSNCTKSPMKEKKSKPFISEICTVFSPKKEDQAITPKFHHSSNNGKNKKVLIVDDDQGDIFLFSRYMERFGIEYEVAYDSKRALEIINKNDDLDLIIMDCYIPILTGFELSKKIKNMMNLNLLKHIPILGISASCSKNDVKICLENGMDYFIGKPVLLKDMKQMLEMIFSEKLEETQQLF